MTEVHFRFATEADRVALQSLLAANQMRTDVEPGEFFIATFQDGLVGAARLEWVDQEAYLRPIVVEREWQGKGVGKALLQRVMRGLASLTLVARREAVGFYTRMGFLPVSWEQVPIRDRRECGECPDREECQPMPMRWVGEPSTGEERA